MMLWARSYRPMPRQRARAWQAHVEQLLRDNVFNDNDNENDNNNVGFPPRSLGFRFLFCFSPSLPSRSGCFRQKGLPHLPPLYSWVSSVGHGR